MGSQFVDFNADGHVDYISATFDGSPHVSYGSKEGFGTPERIKDARGQRIRISSIWNYESKKHENLEQTSNGKERRERCISALAFDWDSDGDYDLLLGSYEGGHLYRQMNEGTNAAPKFTGKNIPVMAGDKPFELAAKMTAPRLVDWDGDGDMDLIAGSFGDSYGPNGTGGGVYLSRNNGSVGKPAFAALETLIAPSPKGHAAPTRPDAGLYVDAVDYDGDGDLDLVVGGYSMWKEAPRELTAEEQAIVAKLKSENAVAVMKRNAVAKKQAAAVKAATAGLDYSNPEYQKKASEVYKEFRPEYMGAMKQVQAIGKKLGKYVPAPQRQAFVWLYERK